MDSRDHAVILGGSIVGTLAARVLANHYKCVTVIDRDKVVGVYKVRDGARQAAHAHAVHSLGHDNLMRLFPDLSADLLEHGVPTPDLGHMHWYFDARRLAAADTGLTSIGAQRPILEGILRSTVNGMDNVTYLDEVAVTGLHENAGRITAATLTDKNGTQSSIEGDLFIDCMGRGSRLPAWLEELGYARPTEERMTIRLTYTSRLFKHKPGVLDDTQSINPVATPGHPRGAFFGRVAPDTCILSLTGILGDRPPRDDRGFLDYAQSLPAGGIYDRVKDCEPLTAASSFGFPSSLRTHYEHLRRFPCNLAVLGDSACSFNPVYGQGIMVASEEVIALDNFLSSRSTNDFADLRQDVSDILDAPWQISTSGDLDFPDVVGVRSPEVLAGNQLAARVRSAAHQDPVLTAAYLQIAGLKLPPTALMDEDILKRIEAAESEAR